MKIFTVSLQDSIKSIVAKVVKKQFLDNVIRKQYYEFLHLIENVHDIYFNRTETSTKEQVYSISRTGLVVPKKWLQETMLRECIQ